MRKGDGLTSAEVRECVRDYVNKENLQHPTDSSIINLDPVIAEVVLVKGENTVVTFRWDKLTSRITNKVHQQSSSHIQETFINENSRANLPQFRIFQCFVSCVDDKRIFNGCKNWKHN